MYPLIEIKSVPIELQFKTTNASLEYTSGTVELEVSRSGEGSGGASQVDTFEQRGGEFAAANAAVSSSMGQAMQAQYQATYDADQGQIQLSVRIGQDILQAAGLTVQDDGGYVAPDIFTSSGVDAHWDDGAIEINYAMDKLNFDWKIDQGEFEFTPGDFEITIAQQNSVTIKYVGDPIYVPKSSDPNYQPVDVSV